MLNSNNELIVQENDLVEMMLLDINPHTVTMENTNVIDRYNHFCNLFLMDNNIDVETPEDGTDKYNKELVDNWYMPEEYKTLDIEEWLYKRTCEEKQMTGDWVYNSPDWIRVEQELNEFKQRGLFPLLTFMVYLVDTMRKNNIVWGVGRGSSVASYVLYLIGVHKINSIKYELDYKEFFR